jgi:hypothetical protein
VNTEDLMLVQQMPSPDQVHGQVRLPAGDRKPSDAGYVLTWTEFQRENGPDTPPRTRRGMVLGMAPPPQSVWVIPDQRCDGEGYAVVVRGVTAADASRAARWVDGPGDYLSTAGWQSPRTLPRALLRVDQPEAGPPMTFLHARPDCAMPVPLAGEMIRRGKPSPVEGCYVFERWPHPASTRPTLPGSGDLVPLCEVCLRTGKPK